VIGSTQIVGRNLFFLLFNHGLAGVIVWVFGSGAIWRMQKQVLESVGDKVAMDSKASMQNKSSIIAVALRYSHITQIFHCQAADQPCFRD
jgi:hypothetical protein